MEESTDQPSIKGRLATGMYTEVYLTSNSEIVFVKSEDILKYDFIKMYENVHSVTFNLSEKKVDEWNDINFYMKRLHHRSFDDNEIGEIKMLQSISQGSMFYDEMIDYARQNTKTKIGAAFADTMEVVLKFYEEVQHNYSTLDFHPQQVLFDEQDNCYILDILE